MHAAATLLLSLSLSPFSDIQFSSSKVNPPLSISPSPLPSILSAVGNGMREKNERDGATEEREQIRSSLKRC